MHVAAPQSAHIHAFQSFSSNLIESDVSFSGRYPLDGRPVHLTQNAAGALGKGVLPVDTVIHQALDSHEETARTCREIRWKSRAFNAYETRARVVISSDEISAADGSCKEIKCQISSTFGCKLGK